MIGASLRVLVVGAGIGGLGAARALRQRGFAAEVVEREPAWTHTGAGTYLPGNATRAQWVIAQTHRRDRTRNLPPALRNLVLRRWGRNIVHANYRLLLELP